MAGGFFGTFDISNTLFSLTEPSSLPRGCFNKRREKGEACMSYSIIFTTHAYPSLLGEEADDVRKKEKGPSGFSNIKTDCYFGTLVSQEVKGNSPLSFCKTPTASWKYSPVG